MTEKIGNITLDYSHYPGEDFYCDGAVEDEILEIVRNHPADEYQKIIEERANWPILYHLSALRENIVEWVPMEENQKVLEVGSGCGAVTGALAKKAGELTCIDLSKKRSLINAHRHKECKNVTIRVGNFKDIEPDLPRDYDYIFIIGVFEYSQGYMGGETPYEDFLTILKEHLKTDGRIIIAIENKFGLKYWAGCREDHLGNFFSGIEDYPEGGGVRTFTRKGLERIMKKVGISEYHFYYPYPDYKFMSSLYSDAYLPKKGELSNNLRNFDRNRFLFFDEKNAFDNILKEEEFPLFSNSYLVVAGKGFPVQYNKFSNDRQAEYAIRTEIRQETGDSRRVFKIPVTPHAISHVESIQAAYEELCRKYAGSSLTINRCRLLDSKLELEYVQGKTLEVLLDECLEQADEARFRSLIQKYMDVLHYREDIPLCDFDLIFSNIIVDDETGQWTIIDYEWTVAMQVSFEKSLFRALYCYLIGSNKRRKISFDLIKEFLGIEEDKIDVCVEQEIEFQHYVTGKHLSMAELHKKINCKVISIPDIQAWYLERDEEGNKEHLQVYYDRGQGFSEQDSFFMKDKDCVERKTEFGEQSLKVLLKIPKDVKNVRIDPLNQACMVQIRKIQWKDGTAFFDTNGISLGNEVYLFQTMDPNITIPLENQSVKTEQETESYEQNLFLDMTVQKLSLDMASRFTGLAQRESNGKKWFLKG